MAQGVVVELAHEREQRLVAAGDELGGPGDHHGADADQLDLVGVERARLHQLDVSGEGDA